MDLIREKIQQLPGILNELDIDVWMVYVRETAEMADPSFKMIAPAHAVWPSAFIFDRSGRSTAIVGRYDAEIFRRGGLYSDVIGYDEGAGAHVRRVIGEVNPRQIALNYSTGSHAADGISHGLFLALQAALEGTPYSGRLVSAEEVVARLRGRKSPAELALIRRAVQTTEDMLGRLGREMKPGRTEQDVAAILGRWMAASSRAGIRRAAR
jgi:Xaa-Pro aminopeptidase